MRPAIAKEGDAQVEVVVVLAELLNEMLPASTERRAMLEHALLHGHVTFTENGSLPDDLVVQTHASGKPIRVSVLGMLNTALARAGSGSRLVAICGDGEDGDPDGLLRFEVRRETP